MDQSPCSPYGQTFTMCARCIRTNFFGSSRVSSRAFGVFHPPPDLNAAGVGIVDRRGDAARCELPRGLGYPQQEDGVVPKSCSTGVEDAHHLHVRPRSEDHVGSDDRILRSPDSVHALHRRMRSGITAYCQPEYPDAQFISLLLNSDFSPNLKHAGD